jgi:glycosyl transferase family 2
VLLSICFTTHDGRRAELEHALLGVTAQLRPEHAGRVEICVADNASQDGTRGLVEGLAREHPIVYLRHPDDLGAARNVLASVAMASGEWCWLHSSDDVLLPGALDAVLTRLQAADAGELAGLTLARANFDYALREEVDPEPAAALPDEPERARTFTDPRQTLAQLGLMQTFLTTMVVRRAAWEAALARRADPLRVAPLFPHAYLAGRILLDGAGAWAWEPRKLVVNRTGSGLFASVAGGELGATILTPTALVRMWVALLGARDPALRALLERARQLWVSPWWIAESKLGPEASTRTDLQLLALVQPLWRLPRFWTRTFPRLLVPHRVAAAARGVRYRAQPMDALTDAPSAGRVVAELPTAIEAGARLRLSCRIEAAADVRLRTAPPHPVTLIVRWEPSGPAPVVVALPDTVRRSRPATIELATTAPWTPGEHVLSLTLEQDGVGPVGASARADVRVTPRPFP